MAESPRFLTVEETAALFRADKEWVYRERWKLLRPAARKIGARRLLFDRVEVEKIIEKSVEKPPGQIPNRE